MPEFESFLQEKMFPLYKAHYALWVHWWPWWRRTGSTRSIIRKWQDINLVREGQTFLDFGCGTGSFTIPAARMVGSRGKVYALDCFKKQLEIVSKQTNKEGLNNVETILSNWHTGLPDESVDIVWMCDVLHELPEKQKVMAEFHRVLKKNGVLAIHDGMKNKILEYTCGLFSHTWRQEKLYKFVK